ncbi:MAG: lipopolysaccharide biosynthesis protein [Clostridia bacterium]
MKSRKEKIYKNIISSVSLNIFNLVISFVNRIIFLHILDVYYLGINSLFSNILGVLSLADLGLSTAMMYSLYKPIADDDTEKIKNLVWFFRKIYLAIAIVVFSLGVSVLPFLEYIINMDVYIPYIKVYYMISLLSVVVSYLFVYRSILISADQKQYVINKISFYFRIITFIVQLVILIIFKNYIYYLLAALILSVLNNFILNKKAIQIYPFLKEKANKISKDEKTNIIINIKSLFIYRFCATLQNNTDNIFISIFVGTAVVGIYSNYLLVVTHITSIISLVFNQIKATMGNILAKDETGTMEKLKLFELFEFLNFWIIAFSAIAFFVLFQDFIFIVFGSDFLLDNKIVFIISALFYSRNIRQTIWVFRETTGLFSQTKYISLLTTIINMVLSVLFGRHIGLLGILLATIISVHLSSFWFEPLVLFHKYFKVSTKRYFVNYLKNIILLVIAGVITYYLANLFIGANIYTTFAFKILICTLVPNILFLIFTFKTKEFNYFRNMLLKLVKSKFN